MKLKNINKKILAGLLGTVMLTTPLGLTACDIKYSIDEKNNSYNKVSDFQIITLESKKDTNIWLVNSITNVTGTHYYDAFSDSYILTVKNNGSNVEGVTLINSENFKQYLIAYDCVQKNYTKEEIEELFNKVKEDFYNNEKGKELVKK